MITEDEESILVIGKQFQNEAKGRSDLTGWRPQRKYCPREYAPELTDYGWFKLLFPKLAPSAKRTKTRR